MSEAVDIGAASDFPDGAVRPVEVRGRTVGVLCWNGELYAFANRCPHMGAPMCMARPVTRIEARGPGELESPAGPPVVACPWHGWEFSVDDGRALADARSRLRTYAISVQDGRVLLDPARHAAAARA